MGVELTEFKFSQNLNQKTSKKMAEQKQSKLRAATLRKNSREELEEQIVTFRKELANLQVAKVTNGGNKVNKIKVVRKNIAKTLTVLNQSQKAELQKFYEVRVLSLLICDHEKLELC